MSTARVSFKKRMKATKAWAGNGLRIGGALLMALTLAGPLTPTPTAEAKRLEWGDVRPPYTDDNDSDETNGFTALPEFGQVKHAIVMAPNGDIFAAGRTAGGAWNIYRSTNQGKNWRAAAAPNVPAGSTIEQLVVSPDYPSDGWIGFVYSDGVVDGANDNGFCWATSYPTGVGATFGVANCLDTGDGGVFLNVNLRTIALSPDFNWNDGNGSIAIGGNQAVGASSVYIAQVSALKTGGAIPADFVATTDPDGDVNDVTGYLAYTNDEEPIALARLWVNVDATGDGAGGQGTYGQILTAGAWPQALAGTKISPGAELADFGQVAFDDEYSAGGSFFAAVSFPGAAVGGVYRFDGSSWANKTQVDDVCNADISSFTVTGNGSSTRIVASLPGSNIVCRSTNEGSSWSDNDADGGDDVCNACAINAAGAITMVSSHRSNPSIVLYSTSAALGGVFLSSSTGSNWSDTGLTNLAYTVTSVRELNANRAFANVSAPTGEDAIFYTDTYGTGAGWVRVLRTSRTDLSFGPGLGDLGTTGKTFARFTNTGAVTDKILVTTNGGMTWDDLDNPDPFENGPDSNENVVAESIRSSSLVYFGGDKGHVAVSTDGGNSWTLLSKDFGEDIDEFDFTSDPQVFFVTGEDSDNTNKVWMTKDGGATFTQVGSAPWGTGDGTINVEVGGYKPADGTGYILVMTSGDTATDEFWRITMPDGTAEDMDLDVSWSDFTTFATPGVGDGRAALFWQNLGAGGARLVYTVYPFTGDKDDMDIPGPAGAGADPVPVNPAKNLFQQLPNPPVATAGALSTALTLPGYTIQMVAGGRIMELTLPTELTGGLVPSSPVNGQSIPTNIGDEGVPAILRWNSVANVDTYEVRIGLTPDLEDATVLGTGAAGDPLITSAQVIIDRNRYALIAGQTYYWDVQIQTARGRILEGPRSVISNFTVSTTSTQVIAPVPNLPLNGANLPGLGTSLSWNNPPGVTQVHVQVTPLNGDGPGINLIMNATNFYDIPVPVFGTGPYVMLPGATYTWRVRVSQATTAVGENDPSWGPWSEPRTFTTAKPNSGTIQLVSPINGVAITDTTPTVEWKDSNPAMFYYEVQVSSDPNFGEQGIKAPVFWNLIHGGQTTPPNSWTVPDAFALAKGQYYWRVRQRVQATPAGAAETGIAWTPAQSFVVQ